MPITERNKQILDWETASGDPDPLRAIEACQQRLAAHGPTERCSAMVNRVVRRLKNFSTNPLEKQRMVRAAAKDLKATLEAAIKLHAAQRELETNIEPETPDTPASAQSPVPVPVEHPVIGRLDLLPTDDQPDQFWDQPGQGNTRRQQFCMSWGLGTVLTRSQMIEAIVGNPAMLKANLVELKFWGCSRDELDAKFMKDQAEVRQLLVEHGFEESTSGLNDLVRLIESQNEPRYEFQRRFDDPNGQDIPQLGLSKTGLLLSKIDFIATWQNIRQQHRPL